MDDTSINVTNTASQISLEPGEFRIFGNQQTTIAVDSEVYDKSILLYPNPASQNFMINKVVNKVSIYDITGKLVRVFEEENTYAYDVSDISPALYFVRIETDKGINIQGCTGYTKKHRLGNCGLTTFP